MQATSTAFHEAGHVVMAWRLERLLAHDACAVPEPGRVGVHFPWCSEAAEAELARAGHFTQEWAGRRASVYYAGLLAELLAEGAWPPTSGEVLAAALNREDDTMRAHHYLAMFEGPATQEAWGLWLLRRTAALLEEPATWAGVVRVAAALQERAALGLGTDADALRPLLEGVEFFAGPSSEVPGNFDLEVAFAAYPGGRPALERLVPQPPTIRSPPDASPEHLVDAAS
jgi:hypothetical protein